MRKVAKVLLYVIISILLLVLVAAVCLNSQWGQNIVRKRAEVWLTNKLETEVRIGFLGVGFPKDVVVRDVFLRDELSDTLLSLRELKVDVGMLGLLHNKLDVGSVSLNGVTSHVYRKQSDTDFNFSFIVKAFAGNSSDVETVSTDTTGSPWVISVGVVTLNDIHIRFNDAMGGMQLATDLHRAELSMKELNVDKMLFHIKELSVDGLSGTYIQSISSFPKHEPEQGGADIQLIADNVNLNNIAFNYSDQLSKLLFSLNLGQLNLQLGKFGLENRIVDVREVSVSNTQAGIVFGKREDTLTDNVQQSDSSVTSDGWNVAVGALKLDAVDFKMDNDAAPQLTKGMDYAHLDVSDIAVGLRKFVYSVDKISGELNTLRLKEKSGLELKQLKTEFVYDEHGAILNKLLLETPNTTLQHHLEVHYPSIASLKDNIGRMELDVDVEQSVIGFKDILLFVPELAKDSLFSKYRNEQIQIAATVGGVVDSMLIDRLNIGALDRTLLLLDSSSIFGLPNVKQISYALNISRLQSSAKDLARMLPESMLASVRVPDSFVVSGNVSGTIEDYLVDLFVNSTDGMASVTGFVGMSSGKGKEKYQLSASTDGLNIGHILRQDSLIGRVTINIGIRGVGFDPKTMNATADVQVHSAFVNGYKYHDITLYGKMNQQMGVVDLLSADSNVRMQVKAHADLSKAYVGLKADIRVDSISLFALGFSSTPFRASGLMHADFPVLNPDYPQGRFMCWEPTFNIGGEKYYPDSFSVVSKPEGNGQQDIAVDLGVATIGITGHIPLTKIGGVIQEHISRHYSTSSEDTTAVTYVDSAVALPSDYSLNLKANIVDRPILHGLLPGLTSFEPIHLSGSLSKHSIGLKVIVPEVVYGTTTLDSGMIVLSGADSTFTYQVYAKKVSSGGVSLWSTNIRGALMANSITTNLSIDDQSGIERFALAASMELNERSQIVHLLPGLVLDYKPWHVKENNRIVLADSGVYVRDFIISEGSQKISVLSQEARANAAMKVVIDGFRLSGITQAFSNNDTLLAAGVLNGSLDINQFAPSLKVSGDMSVDKLSVLGDTLGDMRLELNNRAADEIDARLELEGRGNDIALYGSYFTKQKNGNDFDFQLDVNALAINSLEHIAQNQIKNSSGYIKGKLRIKGTPASPEVDGALHTDALATTISMLNARFLMPSESIVFKGNLISFDNFTIHDESDNTAMLSGDVDFSDLEQMKLDLKLRANDWRAIHSTSKDNKLLYGDLFLSANLDVNGTPTAPVVAGRIRLLEGTDVTVVNPESTPVVDSRRGIVAFVNMSDTGRQKKLVNTQKPVPVVNNVPGNDINVNISVDKSAQFNLIVDPASGDYMSVKGSANLNASVLPGGDLSLAGSYQLSEGEYQMNYNFVKRKFKIAKGSRITFAGDPKKGTNLDITAVYQANIAPYDLVQQQVTDPAELNYYKQRIPFNIDLYMKGAVLKPNLTFDVILPEATNYRLSSERVDVVQSKLSQIRTDTSELNKQVFAVLIMNRFLSDNSINSGGGSSAQYVALQSVSSFIGDQLNRAAGKLVKGVDFSVDLATTEDYTTGEMRQRTDLTLAASKKLLNDRLKITLGNNFELEGAQNSSNNTGFVPSNLAADYLLSADGKYILRAYRKAYDVGVLQGYVTEAGLNFIASFDYNNFKRAFRSRNSKGVDVENKNNN